MDYISSNALAILARVSRQAIEKALSKISNGQTSLWRGAELQIRFTHGAGGQSGTQYEIALSSLPTDLQQRYKANLSLNNRALNPLKTSKANLECNWWLNVLHKVLNTPERSRSRWLEIEKVCSHSHVDWMAQNRKINKRTLYSKLAAYKKHGAIGLSRQSRSDKGQKRVILSKVWDDAVPFEIEAKHEILNNVKKQIRGLLASNANTGTTRRLTTSFLILATQNEGMQCNYLPTEKKLKCICKIPAILIKAEHKYTKVAQKRYDAKAFADTAPRVKRDWASLKPMEIVVCDIHHTNILIQRDDGTTATPKMIAWMDMATRRVWCDLIFFDSRGGVNNRDVIKSFSGMVQHPAWGVPQAIYADNGSEYNFVDLIADAFVLNTRFRPISELLENRPSPVVRARPYNAAAKPIEAWFGFFEQNYLRSISSGWIDDDRMNTPTHKLGKQPSPYAGSFEAFCIEFNGLLNAYHCSHEISGQYGGKTPNELLGQHVEDNWKATIMADIDLHYAFSEVQTRKIHNQSIQVGGRTWVCDELYRYHEDNIQVRIPKWCKNSFNALILEDKFGNHIGMAKPQELVHPLDPRGAKFSSAANRQYRSSIHELEMEVPKVDVAKRIIESGERISPVLLNEPDTFIRANTPMIDGLIIEPSSDPIDFEKAKQAERSTKMENQRKALDGFMAKIKKGNVS